jgi:hypothetical protein
MSNRVVKLTCRAMVAFAIAPLALAQNNAAQEPSARQQLQHIHTPQSIDQQLVRLTKDLELTPLQQHQVRSALEEHHNRIQALLDENPNASRPELGPQIHAISAQTHREIHGLLSDHQKQLEKAMQQREHEGKEHRRPAPPATASPESPPRPLDLQAFGADLLRRRSLALWRQPFALSSPCGSITNFRATPRSKSA